MSAVWLQNSAHVPAALSSGHRGPFSAPTDREGGGTAPSVSTTAVAAVTTCLRRCAAGLRTQYSLKLVPERERERERERTRTRTRKLYFTRIVV